MSKKLNMLLTSIILSITTLAVAITSFIEPDNMAIINTTISGISGAIVELCNLFTKKE